MFLSIINTSNENIIINTAQIVSLFNSQIIMSNGIALDLDSKSVKILQENLVGTGIEAAPKATEYTADLLNQLHKLLGGRSDAKPTTDRKARLKARLKDFTEDELKTAAKNCGTDEFMSGANEQNKRYATLDYLLRTSSNVNKWLEVEPQKKKGMF